MLLAGGFVVLSQATEYWHLFLGMSLFVGLGMSTPYIPTSATIVRWFVEKRGRALALCALGIRRDPGEAPAGAVGVLPPDDEISWTLPEARRTAAFWTMCAIYFLSWGMMFFPYAHLVAIGVDMGYARTDGVGLLSAAGIAGLIGRPAIGWLLDRAGPKSGVLAMLAVQAAAFVIFSQWQSLPMLYVASVFFGIGASAGVTIYPAVVGDTFGRAHVGAIAGFAFAFTCSAGSLGVFAAGWLRDHTGSYDAAFWGGALANVIAMGFALALKPPRK